MLEERKRLLLVKNPTLPVGATVGHCSKDDLGDFEPRFAESEIVISYEA